MLKIKAQVRETMQRGNTWVEMRHVTLRVAIIDNGTDASESERYSIIACDRVTGVVRYSAHRPTFDKAWQYYDAITHGNSWGPRMGWDSRPFQR